MYPIFEHCLMGERIYCALMEPICDRHGLSYTELSVLLFLANNPDLDTASNVSKYRGIAKSHVSVSVRALEARGLLSKSFLEGDRKSIHLKPTTLAADVVREGRAAQTHFGELLLQNISPIEREALVNILKRIDQNIRVYAEEEKEL